MGLSPMASCRRAIFQKNIAKTETQAAICPETNDISSGANGEANGNQIASC